MIGFRKLLLMNSFFVFQVGCKLGAVPWRAFEVEAPLKKTMVVGYDTFHNRGANKKSIGALVASYDPAWTK